MEKNYWKRVWGNLRNAHIHTQSNTQIDGMNEMKRVDRNDLVEMELWY